MSSLNHSQVIDANRTHFDRMAAAYDSRPFVEQVCRDIADTIRDNYQLSEESTTVLDYACGTGLISQNLAPYVKQIIGVDISQGMVDYYNQRVSFQGIPPEEMKAVCIQLKGEDQELDGQKFDIVACAQAYHHFSDINAVTKTLASFLKPGTGKLFVADLMEHEISNDQPHSHSHSHESHHGSHSHGPSQDEVYGPLVAKHGTMVRRGGFKEQELRDAFEGAGLVDWEFVENASVVGKAALFLAIGTRPAS